LHSLCPFRVSPLSLAYAPHQTFHGFVRPFLPFFRFLTFSPLVSFPPRPLVSASERRRTSPRLGNCHLALSLRMVLNPFLGFPLGCHLFPLNLADGFCGNFISDAMFFLFLHCLPFFPFVKPPLLPFHMVFRCRFPPGSRCGITTQCTKFVSSVSFLVFFSLSCTRLLVPLPCPERSFGKIPLAVSLRVGNCLFSMFGPQ